MTKRIGVVLTLVIGGLALFSSAFAQQPSQGRVLRDGTVIWRSDSAVVATTVMAGVTLDVTAQSDRWYEVIIPEVLGGRGDRGLIARTQVQLLRGLPDPPMRTLRGDAPAVRPGTPARSPAAPQSLPRRSTASVSMRAGLPRVFLSVNGAYQMTPNTFAESVTYLENAETARFDTAYTVDRGLGLSLAGGGMISRRIGIGVAVSRFSRATPSTLSGAVPHPFFFNQLRQVTGRIAGLQREELALHAQVRAAVYVGSRFEVAAFAGPSLFRVKQGIVTAFTYTDDYPYDDASFQSAQVVEAKKSKLGFNVGGDAAFFFTRHVGIGFTAMFAESTLDLPVTASRSAQTKAGGLTTSGGVRLRF